MPLKETDHEITIEVSDAFPARPTTSGHHACLVHIFPPGPALGTRYLLDGARLVLGRDTECEIHLGDLSVSRRHAILESDKDGYSVLDLQSTNGTSVNKVAVNRCRLKDGDDLRLGNCIFRFLASTNVEAQYHEELYRLSVSDPLTHAPNRRFLLQSLERELLRSARYHRPLALILLDVDHFKTINDEFGHLGGDFTLREITQRAEGVIRKEGVFGRYGGEEFAVLLPEATFEEAMHVAEQLAEISDRPFQYAGRNFSITVSAGVAVADGDQLMTPEEFIELADNSLYRAKREGRNRVVSASRSRAGVELKQAAPAS